MSRPENKPSPGVADEEPEECLGAALYLLQLVQQDLNMSRKVTVWARVTRAREHLAQLEAAALKWTQDEMAPLERGPEPLVKHRANAKRSNGKAEGRRQ